MAMALLGRMHSKQKIVLGQWELRYGTEKGKKGRQGQFQDSEYLVNVLENLRTLETGDTSI